MAKRVGIDIGGTHTDAVLVDEYQKIVRFIKVPTTTDLISGVEEALTRLLGNVPPQNIEGVFLGTTLALNALYNKKGLCRVGVLRLAGYYPDSVPVAFDWPNELYEAVIVGEKTVSGGVYCDGEPISALQHDEVIKATLELVQQGAESIVINGMFAALYQNQEFQVQEWIQQTGIKVHTFCASSLGGMGFIERENASILNVALSDIFKNSFYELNDLVQSLCRCSLFIVNNNGTIMKLEDALFFPIKTVLAGAVNSFIGGCKLAYIRDAIVIDIGGTSTDIGRVVDFYPIRSLQSLTIAGVPVNLSSPGVVSLGFGGGSRFKSAYEMGPETLAKDLFTKGYGFGGDIKTLTDVAISYGNLPYWDHLRKGFSKLEAENHLKNLIERLLKVCQGLVPYQQTIVLVGGGARLLPRHLLPDGVLIPPYADISNAYGAALAEVSVTIDRFINFDKGRDAVMNELIEEILLLARSEGVRNPRLIEKQILPYLYVPGGLARVIMTAAGSYFMSSHERT